MGRKPERGILKSLSVVSIAFLSSLVISLTRFSEEIPDKLTNTGISFEGSKPESTFEYILFFRKGKGKKINNCGTSDILYVPNKKTKDENGKNIHDTEKPIELMQILIENSSNESDVVLDSFMGVGATALACINTNRNFIGIELDKGYFDIAEKRINEAQNI